MRTEIDMTTGLIIACIAIAAHVLLVLFSKRVSPLAVLGAIYLGVAPFSTAGGLAFVEILKYVRIYSVTLLFVLAIFMFRLVRFRSTVLFLLGYLLFSLLATAWSDNPSQAFLFKTQPLITIMAGVFLAISADSPDKVRHIIRILLFGVLIYAILIWIELVANPYALGFKGRLTAFGINANRIGQSAAPCLIMTAFVALYDQVKKWRMFAYVLSAMLLVIVISSGSRGAVGEALVGLLVLGIPLVRRPIFLCGVFIAIAMAGMVLESFVIDQAADRLTNTELSQTNRLKPWSEAWDHFIDAPIYGQGWVFKTYKRAKGSRSNMHSIYLQALAETGLIGFFLLINVGLFSGFRYLWMYFNNQRATGGDTIVYFGASITAAVLAHGVIEYGTITGTAINAILFGFGVGLIDCLRQWSAQRRQNSVAHMEPPHSLAFQ